MEITEVRIQRVSLGNSLKAYANITFDDCFVLHNVRVIEGNNGLYIGMPSRKLSNGEFRNIAHPITADFRDKMTKAVLETYERTSSLPDNSVKA
ncbi:septation regulator SpoVG [Treponema putidum]|uniref:Putative septation protein SpoVG n=1 Tax=Treponema putidum TaxID=221027 RepID=A0AAE9MVW2_9SPIR|nr:septation regulator SpoVG [Treponema putidum]AIN94861.1 regulatory protein SpoVG [Treponema putidum]TWI77147.1 stage V sporulation protein G [Treponema putidum]UTY28878.1 septation regulator SpoVG [Treponema putidum]UTY31296.1 septation regulator SpoVG [Treponema putidum]UTY33732.1 septation regulator SpoVG [Treponema putidum]